MRWLCSLSKQKNMAGKNALSAPKLPQLSYLGYHNTEPAIYARVFTLRLPDMHEITLAPTNQENKLP